MALSLRIKSTNLWPLAKLSTLSRGAIIYFGDLSNNTDPYVALGGWCELLGIGAVPASRWDAMLALCRHAAIRSRAFAYAENIFEHAMAAQILAAPGPSLDDAEQAMMRAELAGELDAAAAAGGAMYLATADISHLLVAGDFASRASGWEAGLQWAARAMLVAPLDPRAVRQMYRVLRQAGQGALLAEVADILAGCGLHLGAVPLFAAAAAVARGDVEAARTRLKPLDAARIAADPTLSALGDEIAELRAAKAEA